jgi:hypothetical protein
MANINLNYDLNISIQPGDTLYASHLTNDHYLMFAKNKLVNYSGILGYYAETEYRNYSTLPAEIFATAVDYVVSSE